MTGVVTGIVLSASVLSCENAPPLLSQPCYLAPAITIDLDKVVNFLTKMFHRAQYYRI